MGSTVEGIVRNTRWGEMLGELLLGDNGWRELRSRQVESRSVQTQGERLHGFCARRRLRGQRAGKGPVGGEGGHLQHVHGEDQADIGARATR